MNKQQFLEALREGLSQLPEEEIRKQEDYYSEIIDDMTEDGMTEEEAVARLGSVKEIYENILLDTPLPLLVKTKAKPRGGWSVFTVVIVVLGFPLWFSLLAAVLAVVLTVYVSLWAVAVAIFAAVIGIVLAALGFAVFFFMLLFSNVSAALLALGVGFVLAGIAIFIGFGAFCLCKGIVKATAAAGRAVKRLFIRKES